MNQGNLIKASIWYTAEDGHQTRYCVAIDRASPCPLWYVWGQLPDMMICPNNTNTPYNNLFVDLTTAEANEIKFSACPWRQEFNEVRANLNNLIA